MNENFIKIIGKACYIRQLHTGDNKNKITQLTFTKQD
jgi:hypothetical protein